MNSFFCRNCKHKQVDHRIAKWREKGIIPKSLHDQIICWVTLGDGTFCDCLKFEYKNLDYLEMKYEEKSH